MDAVTRNVRSRRGAARAALIAVTLGLGLGAAGAQHVPARVDLEEGRRLLLAGRDSVDARLPEIRASTGDRGQLYDKIGLLLIWEDAYRRDPVSAWSPPNSVEWLLLADDLSDTIATRLFPVFREYVELHPDELLTEGRQRFELANIHLNPPHTRMLGFHVTRMGRFTLAKADSLIQQEGVEDVAGVQEGFLRMLWDWLQQFHQCHADVIDIHASRMVQVDWIIARLKPGCQEGEHYSILGTYMAMDPKTRQYKQRLVLGSEECGEQMTIAVPLPHYRGFMEAVAKLSEEEREKLMKEKIEYR